MTEINISKITRSDIPDFLSLHEQIFGDWPTESAREIFEWKYIENPYFDEIPVIVAKRGGELIGAKGHFGLNMQIGDSTMLGIQTCDLMVHPDHRREGIHKEMIQADEKYYETGDELFFGFPKHAPMRGYLKYGRKQLDHPLYALELSETGPEKQSIVERISQSFGVTGTGIDVEQSTQPDVSTLVGLYEKYIPHGIHIPRTDEFYQWRLSDPFNEYRTYLATFDDITTSVIVSERQNIVRIRDILPYNVDSAVFGRVLEAIMEDYSECNYLFSWCPPNLNPSIFLDSGFSIANHRLKELYSPDIVVRGIEDGWEVSDIRIDEVENWSIQMLVLDY